jgi:alpha-tubulin suppressor-like RCC1 family protein
LGMLLLVLFAVMLGAGTASAATVITASAAGKRIEAGEYHSLALKSDGTVAAWGLNNNGQCNVPEGLNSVVAVAAGNAHSLALKSDGTVAAWG